MITLVFSVEGVDVIALLHEHSGVALLMDANVVGFRLLVHAYFVSVDGLWLATVLINIQVILTAKLLLQFLQLFHLFIIFLHLFALRVHRGYRIILVAKIVNQVVAENIWCLSVRSWCFCLNIKIRMGRNLAFHSWPMDALLISGFFVHLHLSIHLLVQTAIPIDNIWCVDATRMISMLLINYSQFLLSMAVRWCFYWAVWQLRLRLQGVIFVVRMSLVCCVCFMFAVLLGQAYVARDRLVTLWEQMMAMSQICVLFFKIVLLPLG